MKNLVIKEFVDQHAEETVFLRLFRDHIVNSLHYSLKDLTTLDDRLEAHLDGLRIAGDEGWEICKEALAANSAEGVFATSILAFESGDDALIQAVLEVVEENPETYLGLVVALDWFPWQQAEVYVQKFLSDESPHFRFVGLSACVAHRQDPGSALIDALTGNDLQLKAKALQAIGELGRKDLFPYLLDDLNIEDEFCRYQAAWSAALLGGSDSAFALKTFVNPEFCQKENALILAMRRMPLKSALEWQTALAMQSDTMRFAIIGAGAIGDPTLIPWIMEQMSVPEFARIAGEAFSMITGVDMVDKNLEGQWPEGFEAGPTESPEDEDVEMDPDEDLPWPNPELIADWWHKNKSNFKTGIRYLVGKPITGEQCQHVLRTGYQRQRAAAALELAIMNPGTPLFNVCAPGFRQQKLLGLK